MLCEQVFQRKSSVAAETSIVKHHNGKALPAPHHRPKIKELTGHCSSQVQGMSHFDSTIPVCSNTKQHLLPKMAPKNCFILLHFSSSRHRFGTD